MAAPLDGAIIQAMAGNLEDIIGFQKLQSVLKALAKLIASQVHRLDRLEKELENRVTNEFLIQKLTEYEKKSKDGKDGSKSVSLDEFSRFSQALTGQMKSLEEKMNGFQTKTEEKVIKIDGRLDLELRELTHRVSIKADKADFRGTEEFVRKLDIEFERLRHVVKESQKLLDEKADVDIVNRLEHRVNDHQHEIMFLKVVTDDHTKQLQDLYQVKADIGHLNEKADKAYCDELFDRFNHEISTHLFHQADDVARIRALMDRFGMLLPTGVAHTHTMAQGTPPGAQAATSKQQQHQESPDQTHTLQSTDASFDKDAASDRPGSAASEALMGFAAGLPSMPMPLHLPMGLPMKADGLAPLLGRVHFRCLSCDSYVPVNIPPPGAPIPNRVLTSRDALRESLSGKEYGIWGRNGGVYRGRLDVRDGWQPSASPPPTQHHHPSDPPIAAPTSPSAASPYPGASSAPQTARPSNAAHMAGAEKERDRVVRPSSAKAKASKPSRSFTGKISEP